MAKTFTADEARKLADRDDREIAIDALVDHAICNVTRAWPRCDPLTEAEIKSLVFSLHWMFHIAGHAARIVRLQETAPVDEGGARLTRESRTELWSASHSILIQSYVLISGEIDGIGSTFIVSGDSLPARLENYIASETIGYVTWFDAQDARIRRHRNAADTASGGDGLASLVDLSGSLIEALDWLVSRKRPARRELCRCLRYVHAWAAELCATALITPLWTRLRKQATIA